MATEQTNLRLDTAIKAQAIAAAEARGMQLARLVEAALVSYLATDSEVVAENQVVADLIARVERLERLSLSTGGDSGSYRVAPGSSSNMIAGDSGPDTGVTAAEPAAPKQPRQNRQQGASERSQVSEHPSDSLSIGVALLAAGADLTEAQAHGSNYNAIMTRRYGVGAKSWLIAKGWQLQGKKWRSPS